MAERSGEVANRTGARLVGALFVLVLAGCSATSVLNVPQNERAELQVWIREPPGSAPAQVADRLVRAVPERTGEPAPLVALYDDFETKLQQQPAYRQLPDVVINDTGQLGAHAEPGLAGA